MDSETKSGVRLVSIPVSGVDLPGEYVRARAARGLVVLACANRGNARRSAERSLTEQLHRSRISTLRIDLMTEEEAATDLSTERIRRDVDLLAQRMRAVHQWAAQRTSQGLPLGYYGSGAAACAALRLASNQQPRIDALVICEVQSDLGSGRDSQPPLVALHAGTEPEPELLCDLFKNWLRWENKPGVRAARRRPAQDRQSVPSP